MTEPRPLTPRDAVVRITSTAICGSDLHLYDGHIPTLENGDIVGHEFMGEIVEVGAEITNLAVGDRVVVPFTIACGRSADRARLWLHTVTADRLSAERLMPPFASPATR